MDPESLTTLTIDTFKVVITFYPTLLTNILLILMRTSEKPTSFEQRGSKIAYMNSLGFSGLFSEENLGLFQKPQWQH